MWRSNMKLDDEKREKIKASQMAAIREKMGELIAK